MKPTLNELQRMPARRSSNIQNMSSTLVQSLLLQVWKLLGIKKWSHRDTLKIAIISAKSESGVLIP